MNIKDTRKIIFSFLRKEPKLVCNKCDKVLIWDKNYYDFYQRPYGNSFVSLCKRCYYKEVGYPDLFTCISFGVFIYFIYTILNNL